jgi:hypothetical protein
MMKRGHDMTRQKSDSSYFLINGGHLRAVFRNVWLKAAVTV